MPRNPTKRPASLHDGELLAAGQELKFAVAQGAYRFGAVARAGRLQPRTPVDAFTIAFAAAVEEIVSARVARLVAERPPPRQISETVTAQLADQLGMRAGTLKDSRDGERWVTLGDVVAGLGRRSDFGPVFERYLVPLLFAWPYLLHKDAPGNPEFTFVGGIETPTARRDVVEDDDNRPSLTEANVLDLEHQARQTIAALVSAQRRAKGAGRALPSEVDWQAVAAVVDPLANWDEAPIDEASSDDSGRPLPGRQAPGTKTLAEYGIDNMNQAVREAFDGQNGMSAAEVIASVQGYATQEQTRRGLQIEPVPTDPIRAALWRLHTQPPDPSRRWLVHRDGTYLPGRRMLAEKGVAKQP